MKNVHVLPTDKPSEFYSIDGKHKLANSTMAMDWYISSVGFKPHNIYITNSEEIKDGDYGLGFALGIKGVGRGHYVFKQDGTNVGKLNAICNGSKKIILTTDQELIKDGVQAIDDDFLEWFVKNPSCESVKVEITEISCIIPNFGDVDKYKIIIPKEEPKQETLEEVAERLYPNYQQEIFIEGAKWQQEQSYSVDEVEDLIYKICGTVARLQGITLNGNHIDTAYNQHKTK